MKQIIILLALSIGLLSYSQEDKSILTIRNNYLRINKINNWHEIKEVNLMNSTQGGKALFYYSEGTVEKITESNYGETGKKVIEYYFLHKRLSFSYEVNEEYNTHVFDPAFDEKKSTFSEIRNYFEYDKLIKQLNNKDCGSPHSKDYLKEENNSIKSELIRVLLELK